MYTVVSTIENIQEQWCTEGGYGVGTLYLPNGSAEIPIVQQETPSSQCRHMEFSFGEGE